VLVGDAASSPAARSTTKATAAKQVAKKAAKKAAPAKAVTASKRTQVQQLTALLLPAVEANAKDDGWAPLSAVGSYVVNTNPTFDSRNYGYSKLSTLVADLPRLELKEVPSGDGDFSVLYVRAAATSRRRG
jgi:hypothetical protein